jgi:hypothetical protein
MALVSLSYMADNMRDSSNCSRVFTFSSTTFRNKHSLLPKWT